MRLTQVDRDNIAQLRLTLTEPFDAESWRLANDFNSELSELLGRLDSVNRFCLDLTDISRLGQLEEIRDRIQRGQFKNALDALQLAERRLELVAMLDDRIHVALNAARADYAAACSVARCAADNGSSSVRVANPSHIDAAELTEKRRHIETLRHLASEIRMFNNVAPQWIGELIDKLGSRLHKWAYDFIGFGDEELRGSADRLRLWDNMSS